MTVQHALILARRRAARKSRAAAIATIVCLPLLLVLGAFSWRLMTHMNYTPADRPNDTPIRYVVIHCTEEDYDRSEDLLTHRTDASAHYLVRASDGYVLPIIPEHDIAWHCGNREINAESIGIEVEGYISQHARDGSPQAFTDAEYESAARLVRDICNRYNIPMDHVDNRLPGLRISNEPAGHIFGHDQVPDPMNPSLAGGRSHHSDPGPAWDWNRFMKLVQEG